MSDRRHFEIVCPHNHDQTVTFTREEFEGALKSDTLAFHCNTCDTNWMPTGKDIAEFRKRFSEELA